MSKTTVTEKELEKPLTPEELADLVTLHPESIRRAIRDHRIKAQKVGPFWRIPRSEAAHILAHGLPAAV